MKKLFAIVLISAFGLGACAGGDAGLTAITNCPDGGDSKAVKDGDTVEICKGNKKDCFILFMTDDGKTYLYAFTPNDGGNTQVREGEMFEDRNSDGDPIGSRSKMYVPRKAGTLIFIAFDEDGKKVGSMKITIKEKDC